MDTMSRAMKEMGPAARGLAERLLAGARSLDLRSARAMADFVLGRLNPDGGFRGRTAESDLYYTAFALDVLAALGVGFPEPSVADYLDRFGDGRGVDFVHLTCLVRARWAVPSLRRSREAAESILSRLETFRSADGGYNLKPDGRDGSAYAAYLAVLAYDTFAVPVPSERALLRSLGKLRAAEGGFGNEPGCAQGNTPATAAACVLHVVAGERLPAGTVEWLLERAPRGQGFRATADIHEPDLLSTATALVALSMLNRVPEEMRQPCQLFIEELRDPSGGFRGHRDDPTPDCEYTFYGLLALGCLSAPAGLSIGNA